jgi:signal transduction histidine kinase
MSKEEYDSVIQKQGAHSLVLSMSTGEMRRVVQSDLLLRSLVSLLALGGAGLSVLAWRNLAQNSELQIRLVKAGEMNTHLKEMNFAAAGLAHETRNPLNLIRGLAQMIAMQAQSSPKLKEHASTIIEEADRVTVQLNEFINYSKPREAHLGPVEVRRLVADVARTLVPDIEEKHITLRQPDAALVIEADEQLLRQALFNVLLNATQAVAPGGVIEIRFAPTGPREAMLEICDDGPGVPAAERASIFKPYVTMRPKGVGLGLAIVHQIASAHHWEVTCAASQPHGAIFRFSRLKTAHPVA